MTIEEIRARAKARKDAFEAAGKSPGHWADQHGFRRSDVYRVLNGLSPCRRGAYHQIAVGLGIKPQQAA